jgi:hypothetical protein
MDLRPPLRRVGTAAITAALKHAAALTAAMARLATPMSVTTAPAGRIVRQYLGVQGALAANLPTGETTDAPLLSSGDFRVAVGGSARYSRSES